jgi:hypothetical protein
MHLLVRFAAAFALAAALLASPAQALDTGDIVVASIKGEVHITMSGVDKTLRVGGTVVPPAQVRTGHDGAIELRQGKTSVNVGPDTQLEFPALSEPGGAVDRIVQSKGNAFYDIGKREGRRLRVETPYLVGVIKGTQFNVAAESNATTISLFEGRLEVRATDESAPAVDLLAGNIAARTKGEKIINVMKMDAVKSAPAARPTSQAGSNGDDSPRTSMTAVRTNDDVAGEALRDANELQLDTRAGATVDARPAAVETTLGAGANTANTGVAIGAGVNTSVDTGVTGVNTGTSVSVNTGAGNISTDVATNVGANANVGNVATVTTGVDTTVHVDDHGVDAAANVSAGANAGNVAAVNTGTSAVVDASHDVSAVVTTGTTASVGTVASVDTGATAAVNTGTGTVATNVNAGANVAGVNAGANAAVNTSTGTVAVGASLGTVAVNVGVNLGLGSGSNSGSGSSNSGTGSSNSGTGSSNSGSGDSSSTTDTTTTAPTAPTTNLNTLLDSLLGHGKKKK